MNDNLNDAIIGAVRELYGRNPQARQLFDWMADRQKDATATRIDHFVRVLGISRQAAVALAKALEEAGCGEFVVGRRGSPSRFAWGYSRISLGRVAAGETEEVESVSEPLSEDEDEPVSEETPLTISRAKELLANSLGVKPEQIEIQVRA